METDRPMLKLLTVIEARTVTGPVKNLLEFCQRARLGGTELPGSLSVETSLVTFHRGHTAEGAPNQFVAAAREAGMQVEVIGERFRYDPRVIAHLRWVVKQCAPDIIQTHSVKSHFLLRLSGLWRERPWVAFHHGYTTTNLKMRAYNELDRWSLRAAARVMTTSRAFAEQLAAFGVRPERIRVLHNAISSEWSSAASREEVSALKTALGIQADERVVLAVGRLSREKGHEDLIRALAHLRRLDPALKVRLVIAGDGPEQRCIERVASALGISEQVTLAGQVSGIKPYYAAADLLVLPSHSEGSPNVLLEAMAAGLPMVATVVGGIPEIVTHEESALLVEPRAARALAAAIGRLLRDEPQARRLAAHARTAVLRYSPEARLRVLMEIYREVVCGASCDRAPISAPAREWV